MMRETGFVPTDHDDVSALLAMLTDRLVALAGDRLVALWLTGSLTYGDFDRGSSDIDFLVVLDRPLAEAQRGELKLLHERIAAAFPVWAERIEGSYITSDMLRHVDPPAMPRPYINGGAFWEPDPRYGNEWLINLFALRERGVALMGPEPAKLIAPVAIDDVREASKLDLVGEWLPKLDDRSFFDSSHHQAYATLTMCRILHRAVHEGVVSKRVAAGWVIAHVEERWVVELVERALRWQHGEELNDGEQVRNLIRFVHRAVVT